MKPRLTGKMRKALPLLASGLSGVATAEAVGVLPSTVSGWIHQHPAFADELERLREAATQEAVGQLQSILSSAVGELRRVMLESRNDAARLKAALFVIETCNCTKERNQAHLDPISRAELAMVNQILGNFGINHHAATS